MSTAKTVQMPVTATEVAFLAELIRTPNLGYPADKCATVVSMLGKLTKAAEALTESPSPAREG